MLELFDRATRQRVAILQNAYAIREEEKINAVSNLFFSLPYNDAKNALCEAYSYVRYNNGALYRILPSRVRHTDTGEILYTCEHVIATLMDNVLYGYHVIGNLGYYTEDCIRYILDHQSQQNWVLGECDFERQFEYGFEQENLLGALFSLPQPFTERYMWAYDTSTYPWRVNLKSIDINAVPGLYIRDAYNLTSLSHDSDPTNICTRLYPLGYGEGINQLGISQINGGVPYIESPPQYLQKYGIVERVWVDRRYENAESLLSAAQAMLDELQEPEEAYSVSFANLSAAEHNTAKLGEVVRIIDNDLGLDKRTVITGITRNFGEIETSTLVIENRSKSIADTVADLADRQRIEMTYSQGATNLFAQSLQANADASDGAAMSFFIPSEMRIINKVLLKVKLERFRAYSKTSSANGGRDFNISTKTQEQTVVTKSQSIKTSTKTKSITASTRTESVEATGSTTAKARVSGVSADVEYEGEGAAAVWGKYESGLAIPADSSGSNHFHNVEIELAFPLPPATADVPARSFDLEIPINVPVRIPGQSVSIDIPGQTLEITVPSQSIAVKIPGQIIPISIPTHTHEITPGLYRFGAAKTFTLYVDGKQCAYFANTTAEIDITQYLIGKNDMIARGVWHTVEVRPDDLAYVCLDMFVQGFVQSRGDVTV